MILTAVILGLVSSLHCMAMCGPLSLISYQMAKRKTISWLVYHSGRITTYMILGFAAGSVGKVIFISEWQSSLSIILGALFLFFALIQISKKSLSTVFEHGIMQPIRKLYGQVLKKKSLANTFLSGSLNGLLPCGMVYAAVAGAMLSPSTGQSIIYMAAFGLATWPALFAFPIFYERLIKIKINFQDIQQWAFFLVGVMLVLRGMELGIPYVSPILSPEITMDSSSALSPDCKP